jgi:hypothetical protein
MTTRRELRLLLAQGRHALSIGRIKDVVPLIQAQPGLAAPLVELLFEEDTGISQRAADVLERISHQPSPALYRVLTRSKDALLGLLPEAAPKKLRWNLALALGRLPLSVSECQRTSQVLSTWLDDSSSIFKTAALQCLADLTRQDSSLLPGVMDLLGFYSRSGTPAMRARCRILLKKLEKRPRKNDARV